MKFKSLFPFLVSSLILSLFYITFVGYFVFDLGLTDNSILLKVISTVLIIPKLLFLYFIYGEIDSKKDLPLKFLTILYLISSFIEGSQLISNNYLFHVKFLIQILFWIFLFIKFKNFSNKLIPVSILIVVVTSIFFYFKKYLDMNLFSNGSIDTSTYENSLSYKLNQIFTLTLHQDYHIRLNLIFLLHIISLIFFFYSFNKLYKN